MGNNEVSEGSTREKLVPEAVPHVVAMPWATNKAGVGQGI